MGGQLPELWPPTPREALTGVQYSADSPPEALSLSRIIGGEAISCMGLNLNFITAGLGRKTGVANSAKVKSGYVED